MAKTRKPSYRIRGFRDRTQNGVYRATLSHRVKVRVVIALVSSFLFAVLVATLAEEVFEVADSGRYFANTLLLVPLSAAIATVWPFGHRIRIDDDSVRMLFGTYDINEMSQFMVNQDAKYGTLYFFYGARTKDNKKRLRIYRDGDILHEVMSRLNAERNARIRQVNEGPIKDATARRSATF